MSNSLKRSLSLIDVVAIGINGVIGQGIFLLPGKAVAKLGPASIVGILCAGLLSFLIALCFAEVGSRFRDTGGAYVYAKKTFGPFVGFEVGWMTCCVAVIAWAALANGFTLVLGHFIPSVASGWTQPVVAISLMAMLTAVNLFGAKSGAAVSTFFSITKLIPLLLFIALGAFQIEGAQFTPFSPHGYGGLANTTMLLLYAFVGFETLVVPAGEMKNPQRAVPTALLIVLSVVCVVYVAVLLVSIGTLPDLAGHKNPVAAASALFMGKVGGTIVAVGIVISVFGTNAGAALVSPRRFYAFAESGDLPKSIAYVHGDSGAPRVAILLTFLLSAGLTLTGTFEDLAVLSVVARFMQYIPTCLAAIVLRYRDSGNEEGGFRLPLGPTIPILAILLCVLLLANTDPTKLLYGCIALVAGVPLYFLSRSRQTA